MNEIDFYLRHRSQILEWERLGARVGDLLRDAVREGDTGRVEKLFAGESRDAEMDFYVRNRGLIQEWAALATAAGLALDESLVAAATNAGFAVSIGKGPYWTSARATSPELDVFYARSPRLRIDLFWMRRDLFRGSGYPFPRIALDFGNPAAWAGTGRPELVEATRGVARELGMAKKGKHQVHWGMLDPIGDGQGTELYATECIAKLQFAADRFLPILVEQLG